jgi:hypothetical protein
MVTSAALLLTIASSSHLRQILREKEMEEIGSAASNPNIFDYKCFVVSREDQMQVSRGLFRISRGNIWLEVIDIPVE